MESKQALDKIIKKSRVHLYKPIQIAEILYHHRKGNRINPTDVETYRNVSKKWRDEVTRRLVGRISTSSQKFQDNLFESNAMPPKFLKELAIFNNKNNGIVENYIYHKLQERLYMVSEAVDYIHESGADDFELRKLLLRFHKQSGLKRSIDKLYEVTVYALFSTIVRALKVEIEMSMKNEEEEILKDFDKFIHMVLGLSKNKTSVKIPAKLFRVGVTNAADRGLDMWTNFGLAIQVKHVSLSEKTMAEVVDNITADKIVFICLDGEAEMIARIMKQTFADKIQGIITASELEEWYRLCLSKKYKKTLGTQLLADLEREFVHEFPVQNQLKPFMKERGYDSQRLKGEWKI